MSADKFYTIQGLWLTLDDVPFEGNYLGLPPLQSPIVEGPPTSLCQAHTWHVNGHFARALALYRRLKGKRRSVVRPRDLAFSLNYLAMSLIHGDAKVFNFFARFTHFACQDAPTQILSSYYLSIADLDILANPSSAIDPAYHQVCSSRLKSRFDLVNSHIDKLLNSTDERLQQALRLLLYYPDKDQCLYLLRYL